MIIDLIKKFCMKRVFTFIALCCALIFTSCDKEVPTESDIPSIEFEQKEYTLPAEGGDVVIPVLSTGIDFATIRYMFEDAWDFDSDGNMIPREGWISLQVIPNYPESRTLLRGRSGIKLTVKPNKSLSNRTAWLLVGSFSDTESVVLRQPTVNAKQ